MEIGGKVYAGGFILGIVDLLITNLLNWLMVM